MFKVCRLTLLTKKVICTNLNCELLKKSFNKTMGQSCICTSWELTVKYLLPHTAIALILRFDFSPILYLYGGWKSRRVHLYLIIPQKWDIFFLAPEHAILRLWPNGISHSPILDWLSERENLLDFLLFRSFLPSTVLYPDVGLPPQLCLSLMSLSAFLPIVQTI